MWFEAHWQQRPHFCVNLSPFAVGDTLIRPLTCQSNGGTPVLARFWRNRWQFRLAQYLRQYGCFHHRPVPIMIDQLFQIEFSHRSLKLTDVQIIPDGETRSIITRYCLLPRLENGLFSLHTMHQTRATSFAGNLSRFGEDARLRFFLVCNPDDFSSLMDLPAGRAGQLAFSSRTGVAGAGGVRLPPSLPARCVLKEKAVAVISIYLNDLLRSGGKDVAYLPGPIERSIEPYFPGIGTGEAYGLSRPESVSPIAVHTVAM